MRSDAGMAVAALLSCCMLATSQIAEADDQHRPKFGIALEADLEYGGDDLATVSFTDGTTQDIKAGQGFTLALGGHYKPSESSPFGLRATAGYKLYTTAAENADIGIDRMVFEALGSYRLFADIWFGLGLTHHANIKLDGDGFGPNVEFDDATGVTGELGWKWLALSYTNIEYTDEFGGDWDASSLGLTLIARF